MMRDTVQSFSAMLRNALNSHLRADANSFVEMFALEGVMEFPFAPDGLNKPVRGRSALALHLETLSALIEFTSVSEPSVHVTRDPEVFILEFEAAGRGIVMNESFEQSYISVIRIRDGQIIRYTDYWNPLVVLRALKGSLAVDALIESYPVTA